MRATFLIFVIALSEATFFADCMKPTDSSDATATGKTKCTSSCFPVSRMSFRKKKHVPEEREIITAHVPFLRVQIHEVGNFVDQYVPPSVSQLRKDAETVYCNENLLERSIYAKTKDGLEFTYIKETHLCDPNVLMATCKRLFEKNIDYVLPYIAHLDKHPEIVPGCEFSAVVLYYAEVPPKFHFRQTTQCPITNVERTGKLFVFSGASSKRIFVGSEIPTTENDKFIHILDTIDLNVDDGDAATAEEEHSAGPSTPMIKPSASLFKTGSHSRA